MEKTKEIQHFVLCLVVEADCLFLGEATPGMGHRTGKLTGPSGPLWPNHSPEYVVRHYCRTDLAIEALKMQLVAQKYYKLVGKDHDMLEHVYRVTAFNGRPLDTKRLIGVTAYPINNLPFNRMFGDTRYWLQDVASGKKTARLGFTSHSSDDNVLVEIKALEEFTPA